MPPSPAGTGPVAALTRAGAGSDILLVCEHASNALPPGYGDLGLDAAARRAHIAWDIGALDLALALSERLDATLVSATVSRLIYDLNRPPHAPGAMPATSETYTIPGNAAIAPDERLARTRALYLPFHDALHAEIARRLGLGRPPVLITIHSFTPTWFGAPRATELGIIHDADRGLARAVYDRARASLGLTTALNDPYSAADGVTHTLRLHAGPYDLPNVMLEIRNDLLPDAAAAAAIADRLAPILAGAVADITHPEPAGA